MVEIDPRIFDDVPVDSLRRRTSEKWAKYQPDVLPAFIAEMDFPLADPIREALFSAIERDDYGYAHPVELGRAFALFASAIFDWEVQPSHVFPIADVMAGVAQVLKVFTRYGDGVVINPPVYPPFYEVLRDIGRTAVEIPLTRTSTADWQIDIAGLERAFAQGARAYLLCSPHNPVGSVWTSDELSAVLNLARSYGAIVITDEIHAGMTMPGRTHTPLLKLAAESDLVFTVTSASKSWNMPGLKCAVVVAGSRKTRDMLQRCWERSPSETVWRVGHLGVIASIAAFREGGPWLAALRTHLDRNRRIMKTWLQERLPRAGYVAPGAGYLAWIDCSGLDLGDDPARTFLESARVAVSPGEDFGANYGQFVRVNMGTTKALLDEIVERMACAVASTSAGARVQLVRRSE